MDNASPKSGINLPSMTVIFTSLSTTYSLSPELDEVVFNIAAIPYCPPRTPKDREFLEEIKKLCYEKIYEAIETNYSIIIINNTPLTLQVMKELHDKTDKPNASDWLILSFFHEDTELVDNKIKVTETEYLNPQIILDVKSKEIASLSDYPFIKKIYIPHDFQVTFKYLNTLFD